ncbi:Bor family protein [Bacterioplanoides sp.]|uniref:Bor family protein n=1 Tax=Bacterioplanoides sp. TaxID=2066072 RepID=UPI003AFF72E1
MTKKNGLTLVISLLLMCLTACSSVTMRPYGGEKDTSKPTYQSSKNYYWWGLKNEYDIDTSEICQGRRVMQMQSVTTLSDWLLQAVTIGIYFPRTAKVWCEEKG